MLQSMTWFATDNLARNQFAMFSELGEQMQLSDDEQLPAQPQLPVMLRRLGSASHRLAVMADRIGAQA